MREYPSRTLITGCQIIRLPSCLSTNSEAFQLLHTPNVHEGTIVITAEQTNGRGQRGNQWVSTPGKDLTFSVILKPSFLHVNDRFYLNMVVSLALFDLLAGETGGQLRIKWPNDIFVGDKKIGGILIENSIQGQFFSAAVIGVGLNVNGDISGIDHASSLKILTGKTTSLERLLSRFCTLFDKYYLRLRAGQKSEMKEAYTAALYKYNVLHSFKSKGEVFKGIIKGTDESGRLEIEIDGTVKAFELKEVRFLTE